MKGKEKSCKTCTNKKCETNPNRNFMLGGGSICYSCNTFFCIEDLKKAKDPTKCPACGKNLCPQR